MSTSRNREMLANRLARHLATTAAIAAGPLVIASTASADIVYRQWNVPIPANNDGLYINLETAATGTAGSAVAGWDINPYGATSITWFNATGTGMMRFPGVTTGSAGNIAANTPITTTNSYGSGAVVFGSAAGNWQLNAVNMFGFRFRTADGLTKYAWGRMQVGASASDRTLLDTAYETVANTTILAGNQGGPPPAYDPCATFNPVFTIGANSLALNQDTSTTLEGCSAPIYKANYFKFVPPIDGDYTFSTCASGADTRMAVLNGCAAGSTILACNDDSSCGVGSTITIAMTAGAPYYVVIGRANADTALPSPIAATLSSPPNPACGQAVTASFGANPFDNTGSTLAQSVKANATGTSSATINKTIWYAFTPAVTGAYKFSLCGATGDTMLAVGVDCPNFGSRFEALGFNDDAPCNGAASSQSFVDATNNGATGTYAGFPLTQDLVAGTRYLVIAGSWSATSNITGTLLIDGPPPPPADPADLDGNGVVDALDLAALLGAWGTSGVPADINDDGIVDALDLAELLGRWTF